MESENNKNIEQHIKDISLPLFKSVGWIKFLGILSIVYGVMVALSLVGLLIAWLPIWLGVLLTQTATKIQQSQYMGDKEALIKAQSQLSTYFTIYGVLTLIGLIFGVIIFIVAITTGIFAHMQDFAGDYY